MDGQAAGTGLSLAHFQMFSSTRSRFCTSLHWCSNQSSVLIPQLPGEELAQHSFGQEFEILLITTLVEFVNHCRLL